MKKTTIKVNYKEKLLDIDSLRNAQVKNIDDITLIDKEISKYKITAAINSNSNSYKTLEILQIDLVQLQKRLEETYARMNYEIEKLNLKKG